MKKKIVIVFIIVASLLLASCQPTTGKDITNTDSRVGVDYFIIKATNNSKFISEDEMNALKDESNLSIVIEYEDATGFEYYEDYAPIWISDTEIHQLIQWKASKYSITVPQEYFGGAGGTYSLEASSTLQYMFNATTDVNKFTITLNDGKFVESAKTYDTTIFVTKYPFLHIPAILAIETDTKATVILSDDHSVENYHDELIVTIPRHVVENTSGFTVEATKIL